MSLLSFPLRLKKLQRLHKQLMRCSLQFCVQQGNTTRLHPSHEQTE